MVTGIRGDGGQLGTGTPGNSSGRRVVGRTGPSELVHMCSFSISAPSTARRTESAGGETGSAATANPGIPCYEHRAIFVAAAGSDGRPHSNDETRPPNSSHPNTTGYQFSPGTERGP